MKLLLRNPMVVTALALNAGFWIVAPYIPRALLFDLLNALLISVGTGVIIAYAPGAIKSLRDGPDSMTTGHILVLGIICTWVASVTRSTWNWVWRSMGKPPDGIDHISIAYMLALLVLGGVAHMAAKDAINGQVPREGWLKIGALTSAGLMIGFAAFFLLNH